MEGLLRAALAKCAAFIHPLHPCGTRSWGFWCPLFRWKIGLRHEYLTLSRISLQPVPCAWGDILPRQVAGGRGRAGRRAGRYKRGSSGHEKTRAARTLGR